MVVTELALLRLLPGSQLASQALLSKLKSAKAVLESAYNRPFYFLCQIEDPSLIYIVGSWPSIRQHVKDFLPSPANQECLALLKDDIKVEFMFHVDLIPEHIPVQMPVMAIERHFVKRMTRDNIVNGSETMQAAELYKSASKACASGWRIEADVTDHRSGGHKEEFVVFTGWDSREQHIESRTGHNPGINGDGENHIVAVDMAHAIRMEL